MEIFLEVFIIMNAHIFNALKKLIIGIDIEGIIISTIVSQNIQSPEIPRGKNLP